MNHRVQAVLCFLLLALSGVCAAAAPPPPAAPALPIRQAEPFVIRGVSIGRGAPKTIVPTTGNNAEQVLEQARAIGASRAADLIELRIDYLDFATDAEQVAALAQQVATAAAGKPMILTFRTRAEGGAKAITDEDYGRLYLSLIERGAADLFDVEMFRDQALVQRLIAAAHRAGRRVVLSSHDFQATPSQEELVGRLRQQHRMGADVLKIAVMPNSAADVLTLLAATEQVRAQYSLKPQLTMSMGPLGTISRVSGEVFGSDLSFGMIGVASAPGQLPVEKLRQLLDVIHGSLGTER